LNNAGAHFPHREVSADGIEMHVAVNYLPAYGLTTLLNGALRRGRARVVNVASDSLRDTRQIKLLGSARPPVIIRRELDDLTQLNASDRFRPFDAYARAKLLTVMAGYSLARDFADGGVTINAVHPGIVATGIIDGLIPTPLRPLRALIRRAMLTPEQGASAALRLATSPMLNHVTGRYFVRDIDVSTPSITYDTVAQQRLRASSDRFFCGARP
jgi:NAD(P)-dependent dehydrogenase (short-subunit alcohol dehydrogenase family)